MTAGSADLLAELRKRGVTDVDDSVLTRALYSSDASLYRVVPQVVGPPARTPTSCDAILDVAQATGVPLTMRGAGTSIAGNAVGPGIVVDTVRHLNRVVSIDPEARTAVVQPGVVHADLQRAAAPHGLRFGPDPSTHTRCTIGGMIGNNACGSRALGYGRTVDNVEALDVGLGVPGAGATSRARLGDAGRPAPGARAHRVRPVRPAGERLLARAPAARARPERRPVPGRLGGHPRRGPRGHRAAGRGHRRAAPGRARLPVDGRGGRRRARAARGRPGAAMVACEGLDARIVDLVRAKAGGSAVPELPRGARLAVRRGGRRRGAGAGRDRWSPRAAPWATGWSTDPAEAAALWRIREDGAGLAARSLRTPAYSGWEDAAVPPDRLGAWLRDFDELLRGARPRRGALRPLRRRLRARADRLPLPAGRPGARRRSSATSSPPAPSSCATTAARCPASTATAGPAPSCCR